MRMTKRYDVNGRRIALHRTGEGAPTVVFLPGAGLVGLDFLNLHQRVGASVLYDRGGTGWSDPAELPRTPTEVTDELHDLLAVAAVEGPYVLVGHSLGAFYARRYAQRFPAEVAGLLLLDPGHEDLFAHLPPEAAALNDKMKPDPAQLPDLTAEQRAAAEKAWAAILGSWPFPVRDELVTHHVEHWRMGLLESANLESEVYDELRHGGPVPDVPVTVLSAGSGNPAWAGFGSPELIRQALDGIRELHAGIAASFTRGRHEVIDGATHNFMHIERPDAIRDALRNLIATT
jgi:pimeloyl-ACP methyl ester carboxylesterase